MNYYLCKQGNESNRRSKEGTKQSTVFKLESATVCYQQGIKFSVSQKHTSMNKLFSQKVSS